VLPGPAPGGGRAGRRQWAHGVRGPKTIYVISRPIIINI
jgi:hypothetical protein